MENLTKQSAKSKIVGFFSDRGRKISEFFKSLPQRIKTKFAGAKEILYEGNGKVRA